jgi:hypothetical protein
MRRPFVILAAAILCAGSLAWAVRPSGSDLPPQVPEGDREVAWIHAATSGASWERFVAGVHKARHDWPRLTVDDSRAFLDQTTAVPEVVVGIEGTGGRLHIRWYKLTSDAKSNYWVNHLATRESPPLCFIGGGTSDRAEELARALADEKTNWHGPAPLLLITTATANTVGGDSGIDQTSLTEVYPGRSFRFCFSNQQMARAVVDFLWSRPNLRPTGDPLPALQGIGTATAPFADAVSAARRAEQLPAYYALSWDDDPYSSDLASQFHAAFHEPQWPRIIMSERRGIPFSVGEVYRPNTWEALAADQLIRKLQAAPLERRALVLPAGAAQARRVLRALTESMPFVGRNLVAVSGDSINFNNVYRDADFAWDIRAIPVPLVFFAHQNPTAWDAESDAGRIRDSARQADLGLLLPPTATDDVLLHAFLVRTLVESAYGTDNSEPGLRATADVLAGRLREHQAALFEADGNRRGGGEYVVAVLPRIEIGGGGSQVLPSAALEVWKRESTGATERPIAAGRPLAVPRPAAWRLIKSLDIDHARRPDTP